MFTEFSQDLLEARSEGSKLGSEVGSELGSTDGPYDGAYDGSCEGRGVGLCVGLCDGFFEWVGDGGLLEHPAHGDVRDVDAVRDVADTRCPGGRRRDVDAADGEEQEVGVGRQPGRRGGRARQRAREPLTRSLEEWFPEYYFLSFSNFYGARHRVLHREQTFSTENRIHVIRKLVPGLRTASDKASVASQCSLLSRRTIRSTGKGAIARRFKPALHAVSPH